MTRIHAIVLGVALAVLAIAAQGYVWAAHVAPKKEAARELSQMMAALRAERENAAAAAGATEEISGRAIDLTVPQLMARAQEIAVNVQVRLTELAPLAPGSETFRLSLEGSYSDLIRFLARFESLSVEIVEMELGGPGPNGLLPLSLAFRESDLPPAHSFADAVQFEAALREQPPRNPFGAWNGMVSWRPEAGSADLTWVHHLTGVSQIGDMRIATIDNRDYRVGDRIDGRVVQTIDEDTVTLGETGPDGERQYTVGFRYTLADRG